MLKYVAEGIEGTAEQTLSTSLQGIVDPAALGDGRVTAEVVSAPPHLALVDAGALCRDGWAPYRKFIQAPHQSCHAHLLRRRHELGRSKPPSGRKIPAELSDIPRRVEHPSPA
jgi:hypothetical protein